MTVSSSARTARIVRDVSPGATRPRICSPVAAKRRSQPLRSSRGPSFPLLVQPPISTSTRAIPMRSCASTRPPSSSTTGTRVGGTTTRARAITEPRAAQAHPLPLRPTPPTSPSTSRLRTVRLQLHLRHRSPRLLPSHPQHPRRSMPHPRPAHLRRRPRLQHRALSSHPRRRTPPPGLSTRGRPSVLLVPRKLPPPPKTHQPQSRPHRRAHLAHEVSTPPKARQRSDVAVHRPGGGTHRPRSSQAITSFAPGSACGRSPSACSASMQATHG